MERASREDDPQSPPNRSAFRPLVDFLHTEAASGAVLLVATVVALVWANSPWKESYVDFWGHHLKLPLRSHTVELTLQEWVNDTLMVIFFFVVGLEIKRELVAGELRDPRRAAMPAIAAVGGMVLPGAIFLLVTAGSGHSRGWGIPMATDIAMAVGVLSLLGNRVAPSLKLFVLALAIVDDIGAILVIALVYSEHIHLGAVVVSLGILLAVALFRRVGVRWIGVYVALGVLLWFGLHEAGVHTTLVGVTMGLLTPTQPIHPGRADSPSLVEWLEHFLHPWSSFVVLPLFALANAGVPLSVDSLRDAASSTVAWGVLLGLVVGKTVGITVFTWLARRFRIAALPNGADWRGICGVAVLCGIGFTVSIFVTGLAYRDEATQNEAKIGILFASVTAAAVGSIVLATASRPRR